MPMPRVRHIPEKIVGEVVRKVFEHHSQNASITAKIYEFSATFGFMFIVLVAL